MFHDDGYALFIGIDDYSAFDRSTGKPEGTSSLEGSVLDAHVFFRLCIELGMKPENLRVVASPRPDLSLFPGATEATLGDASEKGIRDAIGWLADKLAGGRAGLLTYSGHGAHTRDKGLLICPSDTAGASFDHAIPFHELRAMLGDAAKNLTVVLDCCHGGSAGTDARGRRAPTLGGDALPPGERADEMMIGARVLAACKPGELTQQALFGGRWHGAFSWALGAVVDQWKAVGEGGNVRLDLSYSRLVEKAQELLAVLDFKGTPALYGPEGVEALAVLQVGSRPETTSAAPDGERVLIQLDPNYFYTIYLGNSTSGTVLAQVVVPNNNATVYLKWTSTETGSVGGSTKTATEYWFLSSTNSVLNQISSSSNLFITKSTIPTTSPTSRLQMNTSTMTSSAFTSPSSVTWRTSLSAPTTGTNTIFSNSSIASPTGTTAYALFNVTGTDPTYTLAHVYWYLTGLASAPSGIQPDSSSAYSTASAIPSSPYYAAYSH